MNRVSLKYKLIFLIVILINITSFGQSNPKLSNYEFSPLTYNPSFAGSDNGLTISSLYSTQWQGFEGAPETQLLAVHSMISPQIGVGIDIINDQVGASKETQILTNFAYKIDINQYWKITMGIKAGFSTYRFDFSSLNIENPFEINILSIKKTSTNFNFGTGFYLYNGQFYLGVGVPNLIISEFLDSNNDIIAKSTQHYYITTGHKFILNNEISFWPTMMIRFAKGAPVSSLVNFNLNWKDQLYSSLNLDPKASLGGYFGIRIFDKFIVGYSYDTSINNFNNYNSGNHTIFLKVNLNNGFLGVGPHSSFFR